VQRRRSQISVVLSTFQAERLSYVSACIESLEKQTLFPEEIILSLDPDKALFEFYKAHLPCSVKIVAGESRGLSNSRNAALNLAKGEIVAFIDDDAFADEKWLENLVKNYENPSVIGAGGLVEPVWEKARPLWFPEELDWIVGCSYKPLPQQKSFVRNVIGCNMSFRRKAFGIVGHFNSNLGRYGKKLLAGEEAEFFMRVAARLPGSKIVYDPSSVVYHRVPQNRASFRYLLERSFYEGLSKALIGKSTSNASEALSPEQQYLLYLVGTAMLKRMKRLYRFQNLSHILAMLSTILAVFSGYAVGSVTSPPRRN
jgi:cellulose synthase/poly-beta-1,6-N-acetylglucosamine synthase-like glycosyltransferase